MDAQIENAIEIAWNPTADQNLKAQAFEYLNQLRAEPQGWQICTSLFTQVPRKSDVVRLVSLEIVNNVVQNGQTLDAQGLVFLRDALVEYVKQAYGTGSLETVDPPGLQNKLAQTLTYLFVSSYGEGWQTFIDDFLALTHLPNSPQRDNAAGVALYLRILSSVHDEIADLMLSRMGFEAKRNNSLKDLVRERDMQKIASSWQDLLALYGNQDDMITQMVLQVIAKWVSWIDISLVVDREMLKLLLPLIGRANPNGGEDLVRNAAIQAFTEVVAKKMKPADKTELILFLNLRDIVSQLIDSPPLNELKGTPKYDTDLGELVASLVNNVMTDVVRILEDNQVGNDTRARAEQHLRDFLPFLLRFFSDEYDEICSTVIPSLTDLLTFLRKVGNLPPSYAEMLPPILNAVVMKMRYDETSEWGSEDDQTDEAEFQELRKRLQILQKSIAAIDETLYIETLSNLVANTFQRLDQEGGQMDWRDLDVALYEMFLFGELALPNTGLTQKSPRNPAATERLVAVMSKMIESGVASFPHPAILLQYMEICVRYSAFFEAHQNYIPQVLENFVRLVHHQHVRIRTRSWYLLSRLVKQLRAQVGNVAETVIQSISDLLPIKAEVSGDEADDDMSSDESDHSADAVFNSQLFLYETIGTISSTGATTVDNQALYARSVMNPLFSDVEKCLPRAKNGDAQAILQIHHIILALGTLAGGFSDWTPGKTAQRSPPDKLISEQFSRTAEVVLVALKELNDVSEIRTASRSAFARLLGVLGSSVLPQLPQWIEGLLSPKASRDEMAMFLRTLEQIVFAFKGEIYTVLDLLLTPLLQRIFAGLSSPIEGTDDEIQLSEMRREFLSFIQVILNQELGDALVSETNQGMFETLISSIIDLARNVSHQNVVAARLSFMVLWKMASLWGGPDVATISANPVAPTGSANPAIPGFDQFMIQRFHGVCVETLQATQLQPNADAQTKQLLGEVATLEQTIYIKTGDAFIQHLQSVTFPALGIEGSDYLRSLTTSTDKKSFANYLQELLKSRRR